MKVLLIEDDVLLAEAVSHLLRKNNFFADICNDGSSGLDAALCDIYDIILLDIMLPGMDGIQVLREMREEGIGTPVILLTAKGELQDRVKGLDQGADDYLPKPFETEELLARMRAVLRRKGDYHDDGVIQYGDLSFSPHTREIRKDDKTVFLSTKESQLLEMLMEHSPRTLSKDRMIEKLWGYDSDATDNHVETHISLLRKKLRQTGSVVTVRVIRGLGYLLLHDHSEVS